MSNSLLYPLKRFSEKVKIEITQDRQLRAKYNSEFIGRRVEELVYLVENDKTGFFEEARNRYISSVGEYLVQYNNTGYLKERKNDLLVTLSRLRDKYPSNSAYWLILQQTVDVTNGI